MSLYATVRKNSEPTDAAVRAVALLGQEYALVVADPHLSVDDTCIEPRSLTLSESITLYLFRFNRMHLKSGGAASAAIARPMDLTQLLREHLAVLDDRDRVKIIAFASQLAADATLLSADVAAALRQIREALRPRLPSMDQPDGPQGLRCETIVSSGDGLFGIWGWQFHHDSPSAELHALSPEGVDIDLTDRIGRHTHRDVDRARTRTGQLQRSGFFCTFEAPASSSAEGWLIYTCDLGAPVLEARTPCVLTEPATIAHAVLNHLADERHARSQVIEGFVHPILSRVQQRQFKLARAENVRDYGAVNSRADVSIVIPIFEQPELVEQQLAAFAGDHELAEAAQIIYVLDSPWMLDEFERRFAGWSDAFAVPFRFVAMTQRAGWAGAAKVGCAVASGASLLLMHSDVLPSARGWLGPMLNFHRNTASVGAVGCQLLYPDGSVQHQGLAVTRSSGGWRVRHPLKGLNAALFEHDVPRPVAAVSAACLMVDRQLFHDVGGLCGEYPFGEFEDVDLCLRLAALRG